MTVKGGTVWLTGLPSAGKSTVARALSGRLSAAGCPTEVLDGDEMRAALTADLGFSPQDRDTNVRRIGFVAQLLAQHGILAIVPVIAPYTHSRQAVRDRHRAAAIPFLEIHVAAPVAVCAARDVKELYAKQASGEISGLTGVDAPYESPTRPDLRLDTHRLTVDESVTQVHDLLLARRLI
ncbi:adenylyl-sulfate kinase [Nocardia sp. NPDC004722]